MSVLLKKPIFESVTQQELAEQLEGKKRCRKKLPTWFESAKIYYPKKVHIEQSSSEATALFKASLLEGKRLIDLTGGLGVDCYFFAQRFETVFHCESNPELSEITAHNFSMLNISNIDCFAKDGFEVLADDPIPFDWIYVDPSRRDASANKVYFLADCIPNVPERLSLLFGHAKSILVKTAPLLDIKQGLRELDHVATIYVVALENEVKELLWMLQKGHKGAPNIVAINLGQGEVTEFRFTQEEEELAEVRYASPKTYLYEPHAALMKSGGFRTIAKRFAVCKIAEHSHLYTSDILIDFPGRRFKIVAIYPYSKEAMRNLPHHKANISTRNFPINVAQIRKKHRIADGGSAYLFFTTDANGNRLVLSCTKINH